MPTIYTQVEKNVSTTWILISIFILFVITIGWIFSYAMNSPNILVFAVILSILMSFGSYWYSDRIVLALTRARPIEKTDNPEIYRIVENLCIAAGLPMPKIYILNEIQQNAFATGRDPQHAVIAVTKGLLEKLDKSELEGVISHELSHIGNKDILLQTVVVILAGMVTLASNFFLRSTYFFGGRRNGKEENNIGSILFLIGIILAILSPLAATLIRLAISRKREFLADTTGALLTRYPDGLARALEKISADASPLKVANEATAHLYISSPFKGKQAKSWLTKLFMTHPPIEERIRALKEMNF